MNARGGGRSANPFFSSCWTDIKLIFLICVFFVRTGFYDIVRGAGLGNQQVLGTGRGGAGRPVSEIRRVRAAERTLLGRGSYA